MGGRAPARRPLRPHRARHPRAAGMGRAHHCRLKLPRCVSVTPIFSARMDELFAAHQLLLLPCAPVARLVAGADHSEHAQPSAALHHALQPGGSACGDHPLRQRRNATGRRPRLRRAPAPACGPAWSPPKCASPGIAHTIAFLPSKPPRLYSILHESPQNRAIESS